MNFAFSADFDAGNVSSIQKIHKPAFVTQKEIK